jgi:hypothetical protein
LFKGTCFTAQSFCPRIAVDCHWQEPNMEDACPAQGSPESRFGRGVHAVA